MIYFQWQNSSDTFVIATVFLFIPEHHQNTIVHSLVLILYSFN